MPALVGALLAPILIESVTVRDFRGIADTRLDLGVSLTVLVGRNNIGKSRLLRAIAVALGAAADSDDFTVGHTASPEIDVVVRPAPHANGDELPFAPVVEEIIDPAIVDVVAGTVRWAFRCTLDRRGDGSGVQAQRHLLTYDAGAGHWALLAGAKALKKSQVALLEGTLIDARRDLGWEVNNRGTAAWRVLSDLEVEDGERKRIEGALKHLGADIVAASASLGAMATALQKGDDATSGFGTPSLAPLPVRLEELSRALSLDLDSGNGPLPIRLHGSGPRSLSSVLVQQVVYERRLGAGGTAVGVHPVTLLEEPEAHLHPQVQQALPELLEGIPGQVVVSTHSTHFVAELDPSMLRLLRETEGVLSVLDLTPVELGEVVAVDEARITREEYEKIRRLIERPLGELLFADAVVIGDGATERAMIPLLLRHSLKSLARGVVVVDPVSMNQTVSHVVTKFAEAVGIPWVLFADGDTDGRKAVKDILKARGLKDDAPNVIFAHEAAATEDLLIEFDADVCERALNAIRPLVKGETILEGMKRSKGVIGRYLAQELIQAYPEVSAWPPPLKALSDVVAAALTPPDPAAEQPEDVEAPE